MNRETYTYAYGFIAGILLAAFVIVISYAMCDYYCDKMLADLVSNGTVIIVKQATIETVP